MADEKKQPSNTTSQRPAGAPEPPAGVELPHSAEQPSQEPPSESKAPLPAKSEKREPSEVERKADELMTPDPYPNDPDSGPGKGPSFSSPAAMVGWFCLGFFFGLIGLLVTLLLVWRRDPAVRSRAITYSCLGVILEVVLGTIAISMLGIDPNTVSSMQMGTSSSTSSVW